LLRLTSEDLVWATNARRFERSGGIGQVCGTHAIVERQKVPCDDAPMDAIDLAISTHVSAETPLDSQPDLRRTDELGERIAALAAGLHAATYHLLMLLREFDARNGWTNGFLSCAHWLHWRTGIDLGASREKVRVARALAVLPRISACMEQGQVSYAKVRALTRVATPENEATLLGVALAGTAAHVERFVRAWRRVNSAAEARVDERRFLNRHLSIWVDDDGMVVIRGRLTPEAGAVVQRALEAAADRAFRETRTRPAAQTVVEEVTAAQRRADALALLAETALTADLDRGTAGDRYQVVIHVDADGCPSEDDGSHADGDRAAALNGGPGLRGGVMELDHVALHVSAEMSRRLSCDAAVVRTPHSRDTAPAHDSGRRTRTIPVSIRRALATRDRTCRFPGCTSRRCDAHHIEHWVDGGATRLDNLVMLCRRHHRAVHEGGFRVVSSGSSGFEFHRPGGARLETVPGSPAPRVVRPLPPSPTWDGTRFDIVWAIDVLWDPGSSPLGPAAPPC
jgi:hypothetical protein